MPGSTHQPASLWAHQAGLSSSHATSPIASHLLVACGTQHLAVRLVDLRSSAAVQSLVSPGQIGGSAGANLAVAWSPVHDHILASESADGAVSLGYLCIRASAKAHNGPVNGLTWTDDGAYIVSAGHDRQIRVWDAAAGANTVASFGPTIRNDYNGRLTMFVSPIGLTPQKKDLLFYPNENEILVMDLHEGTIIIRLRGMAIRAQRGERTIRNFLSSKTLDEVDESTSIEEANRARAKKRKVLDDAFRSLMGRQITLS
ncbi:hypothetical protein B0H65DRAFT_506200 [Neurospora tetraspora]|uniref:WD40 repeat-like protein n=1 Tax=Neurospora tetraspora TaxID=94610 RepID=A0AAE0JJS9_9PEZI|nr:hypothetical protein B0H65DRAFT_506200 [Neurospora tetraspora]